MTDPKRAEHRGTLESFIKRARALDLNEEDRALAWKLFFFLFDEIYWNDIKARFIEQLEDNPVQALALSNSIFETAASFEVARKIRKMFESGVSESDMIEHCLHKSLRQPRSPGGTNLNSTTSNLIEDAEIRAWAVAYGRLTGRV
jgi:hypothetical protein